MASKQFLAAIRTAQDSKNLDTILPGSGYLGKGTHDITIQTVDVTNIDKNRVGFVYIDGAGKSYNDSVFLMDFEGNVFSQGFRYLLAATIPNTTRLAQFLEALENDDHAFEMLTGMKFRVTLDNGKGFQIRATGLGGFAAYDAQDNEKMTDEKPTLEEAKEDAEARGMKRSYLKVVKSEATNVDDNARAFDTAIAGRSGTTGTNGGVVSSNFTAGAALAKAI